MAKNPTHYHGDLEADLKRAALAAVVAEGPAAVSLRSLARELGVSHAAPKNHFTDKAALFAALAVDGFNGLSGALGRVIRDADDWSLLEAGVAYVAFALEHPGHFAVMWQTELYRDDPEVAAARHRSYLTLVGLVALARPESTVDSANRAWAQAHGWAALLLSGSLTVPPGTEVLDYVREQLTVTHRRLLESSGAADAPAS